MIKRRECSWAILFQRKTPPAALVRQTIPVTFYTSLTCICSKFNFVSFFLFNIESFKCVMFYSLCCCICYSHKGKTSTKESFMRRFTKWIKLGDKNHRNEDSKMGVVKALMRLYAHQTDAIKDLKELCRVNPDFNSHFRNDLEFYVP